VWFIKRHLILHESTFFFHSESVLEERKCLFFFKLYVVNRIHLKLCVQDVTSPFIHAAYYQSGYITLRAQGEKF